MLGFPSETSFSFTISFSIWPWMTCSIKLFLTFRKNLTFFFFCTTGVYFEFEYLQLFRQKFQLTPAYIYCTILYFHHYEVLFQELLSVFLNYGFFAFFFFLEWFRESYAKFPNLIFWKIPLYWFIENIVCVLSFKL